jgi:hypothetical protein
MICREYQNQIVLSLYEELEESAQVLLETHILECSECRQVFDENKSFHTVLAEDTPAWELPAELLMESRRALANELDRMEKKRSWWSIPAFSVVFTPMRMLESAALVAMGLALGVYVSNSRAATEGVQTATLESELGATFASAIPQGGRVSNVRIVYSDASTGVVKFTGDVVQPLSFQGRMEDNTTQQLLFSAVQDSMNPGSRLQAMQVLARQSAEPSVKGVLIHALLNDGNLAVRLKALDSLKPFASEEDVRVALIQALMKDPDDGIRVAAVDALAPFTDTAAMANRIEQATRHDDNTYVRLRGQGLIQLVGTRK